MILNMLTTVGGVDGEVTTKSVTFYGGVNETLTLNGPVTYSVNLNENGMGIAAVQTGTYVIIGSKSKEALPNGKTVEITSSTSTATAYPDGAIFWFGNGDSSTDSLASKCGNFVHDVNIHPGDVSRGQTCKNQTVSNNADNISLSFEYNGYGTATRVGAEFYFNKALPTTGYTKLKVLSEGLGTFYTVNSIVTNYSYVSKASAGSLATLTPASYLTYYFDDFLVLVNNTVKIKAIYLE